ncbi:MAG: metalloregulator ArsR/SmtB family transcription factor [Syntrophaceae bacterium]|nr:metalloregulator ArsR/SmtB family transcription factor [Syntrophaceae bacterium]
MKDIMTLIKAVSDENRVRLLMALRGGELCVCQLIEFIDLAPSTVSKHMSILRNAHLVESRKKGRWVYYRLTESHGARAACGLISWLRQTLEDDSSIVLDMKRLGEVLERMPSASCEG